MNPKISVIICTYNRQEQLAECLGSIKKQTLTPDEIIVVNDGSTDQTKKYLESLTWVKSIHLEKNTGKSAALNAGIKYSQGEILAFTDDDCLAKTDWLEKLVQPLNDIEVGFSYGSVIYVSENYKGYFPERIVQNPNSRFPGGGNIAYRKKIFDTIGGYGDEFYKKYKNEDTEMALRAVDTGWKYAKATEAVIYHQKSYWNYKKLIDSAKNASVWVRLKRMYPNKYLEFSPPIALGHIVYPIDYIIFFTLPISLPLLLIRFFWHRQWRIDLLIFRWTIFILLRRFFIWKEVFSNYQHP